MSKKDLIANELYDFRASSAQLTEAASIVSKLGANDEFTKCLDAFMKNITNESHYRFMHADLARYIRKLIYKKLEARLDIKNKPNAKYRQIEDLINILHCHVAIHNNMTKAQIKAGYDVLATEPTYGFIGGDLSYLLNPATAAKYKKVIEDCKKEQIQNSNGGVPVVWGTEITEQRFIEKKRTILEKLKYAAHHFFKFNFLNINQSYTNGFRISIDLKSDRIIINTNRADGKTFKKEAEIFPIFTDNINESIRITEQDIIEIIEFDIDANYNKEKIA
ncbi:hypothetical protein GIV75_30175 [Pseudomonas sp. PA-3-5D]|uniref:hypothetical protein n=3 Tax=Pseudomonas TaxID=286 RepID=UPI001F3CE096|nr:MULTISPECIES: hypothetical protein [unclassified Pseudomonas]MCF5511631.1 hypothetical protein [Pseudomonas sp. PA-3-6H]MCF5565091.1 hypothetical protein [Pseudomonas sp. PA-3-5D]